MSVPAIVCQLQTVDRSNTATVTIAIPPLRSVHYWLLQLGGWTIYGALLYAMSSGRGAGQPVLFSTVWCLSGMTGTHVFRTAIRRYRCETTLRLAIASLIATFVIPLAMTAVQMAATTAIPRLGSSGVHGNAVVAHFVQGAIVIGLWCAAFVCAHEARRRRAAETQMLRSALAEQVAQFHTLRGQLNPHFLFNCLNGLRELIADDPDRAQHAVMQLSDLLRYTLRADRVETVSLDEELRAVGDYVALEKLRFEERLRFSFHAPADVRAVRVPPMLVQTLVENALKHGVARVPGGGDLEIAARAVNGVAEIVVSNTGALPGEPHPPNGVGLSNARERLRLLFGGRAALTLNQEGTDRVCARLMIPMTVESRP